MLGWAQSGRERITQPAPTHPGAQQRRQYTNRIALPHGKGCRGEECARHCGNTDKKNLFHLGGILEAFMGVGMAVELYLEKERVGPVLRTDKEATEQQGSVGVRLPGFTASHAT